MLQVDVAWLWYNLKWKTYVYISRGRFAFFWTDLAKGTRNLRTSIFPLSLSNKMHFSSITWEKWILRIGNLYKIITEYIYVIFIFWRESEKKTSKIWRVSFVRIYRDILRDYKWINKDVEKITWNWCEQLDDIDSIARQWIINVLRIAALFDFTVGFRVRVSFGERSWRVNEAFFFTRHFTSPHPSPQLRPHLSKKLCRYHRKVEAMRLKRN